MAGVSDYACAARCAAGSVPAASLLTSPPRHGRAVAGGGCARPPGPAGLRLRAARSAPSCSSYDRGLCPHSHRRREAERAEGAAGRTPYINTTATETNGAATSDARDAETDHGIQLMALGRTRAPRHPHTMANIPRPGRRHTAPCTVGSGACARCRATPSPHRRPRSRSRAAVLTVTPGTPCLAARRPLTARAAAARTGASSSRARARATTPACQTRGSTTSSAAPAGPGRRCGRPDADAATARRSRSAG